MRWGSRKLKVVKTGDRVTKKSFLFFPKTINNQTRWLEFATYEQEFRKGGTENKVDGGWGSRWESSHWKDIRWVNE